MSSALGGETATQRNNAVFATVVNSLKTTGVEITPNTQFQEETGTTCPSLTGVTPSSIVYVCIPPIQAGSCNSSTGEVPATTTVTLEGWISSPVPIPPTFQEYLYIQATTTDAMQSLQADCTS